MTGLRMTAFAAVSAAVLGATGASAATVAFSGASVSPSGSGRVSVAANEATFDWSSTAFTGSIQFTANATFDIFLTSLAGDYSGQVSGWVLERLSNASGASAPLERLTSQTTACASAAGSVGGECNFVGQAPLTVQNGSPVANPSTTLALFEDLTPGSYLLGFFDSATPSTGSATFAIAPVPIPAPAALLLGGLAALVVVRRRRATA